MKVWIDPGHGGEDPGAVKGSRYEKDDVLRLAKLVADKFHRCNIETVMTRTTDVHVSMSDRTGLENRNNCDLAISIHRNAASPDAHGVEIWMHSRAPQDYIDWGNSMLKEFEKVGISSNRGVKQGYHADRYADYAVNRETNAPSMMIEMGFVTNSRDNEDFDKHINGYADAIVKASCEYIGADYVDDGGKEPDDTDKLYRVQVGAFKDRGNAQKLLDELKGDGYNAFIV